MTSGHVIRTALPSDPWVARIRSMAGDIYGAGVLLDARHVLTCAHVVDNATGRRGKGTVLVDFPAVVGGQQRIGRVVGSTWFPPTEDGRGDLSALVLQEPVTGLSGARVARIESTARNTVRLYGYPVEHPNGVRVFARLSGPGGPGWEWVQLDALTTTGQRIQGGFSGTPVVDEDTGVVIGIAVAADRDAQAKVAWMLPVRTVAAHWEAVADCVVGWSVAPECFERFFEAHEPVTGLSETGGGHFTGRRAVLTRLVRWLGDHTDSGSYVVTGDPGSGKSAVLRRIVRSSDRALRQMDQWEGREGRGAVPEPGAIGAAVYAAGATVAELVRQIAVLADVEAADAGTLVDRLTEDGRPPFTVVIDAVDEAADPDELVERLLIPLMDHGRAAPVRLLLGSRRDVARRLERYAAAVIDLDDGTAFDQADMVGYVTTLLTTGSTSPYRHDAALAATVGQAVAERAGHNFLIARLVIAELLTRRLPVDVATANWGNQFPSTVSDAMKAILTRLEDTVRRQNWVTGHRWVRDILTPLAYAEGQGLAADGLWADLASALSPGCKFTEQDIHELIDLWATSQASNVLKPSETGGAGGPAPDAVWRLFHQALADHLRDPHRESRNQARIVEALLAHVPKTSEDQRDWSRAHPYVLRSLATHAAAAAAGSMRTAGPGGGNPLDELVTDPGFLIHADPDTLSAALRHVTSAAAKTARAVFLTSMPQCRLADVTVRRQLLAVDAARLGKHALRQAFGAGLPWAPRWATGSQVTAALRASLTGHTGSVEAVACTTVVGAGMAVTGGGDHTARVWELATGRQLQCFDRHRDWVRAVACTTLGGLPIAVTAGNDRTARVWELATGRQLQCFDRHRAAVQAVAVTEVARMPVIVTASADGTVWLWDPATGGPVAPPLDSPGAVSALSCVDVGGHPGVVAVGDGAAHVWDLTSPGRPWATLEGHAGPVTAVTGASLDTKAVAVTGSRDGTARVWDLVSGGQRGRFDGHPTGVTAVACTTVDRAPAVVTACADGSVRIWDLDAGVQDDRLVGHSGEVTAVACATVRGRPVAVTGSTDRTAAVWDLTTGDRLHELAGHSGEVMAVSCAVLDGMPVVVTAGADASARIWCLTTGTPRGRPLRHATPVLSVACAAVGRHRLILTGGHDGAARAWDPITGRQLNSMRGHAGPLLAMACTVAAGRSVVVTGSRDYYAHVWSAVSGQQLARLSRHDFPVRALTCTDGDTSAIVVAADGCMVRWWHLDRAVAERRVGEPEPVSAVTVHVPHPVGALAVATDGCLVVGSGHEVVVFSRTVESAPLGRHS